MVSLPVVDVLDAITIPITCPVSWHEMHGDDRTRFCDMCSQNVHDVSRLTRAEAMELLSADSKLPCLRIYRRPDGRVMTADCTNRRERVLNWLRGRSAWAAWLFALVFFAGCDSRPTCSAGIPVFERPEEKPAERLIQKAAGDVVQGIMSSRAK
jgi:hypothetical protein